MYPLCLQVLRAVPVEHLPGGQSGSGGGVPRGAVAPAAEAECGSSSGPGSSSGAAEPPQIVEMSRSLKDR